MPAVFYQSVGNSLTQWHVDVAAPTLTPRASVELPFDVHNGDHHVPADSQQHRQR